METSWVIIMASQTLPWWGKRGLRSDVASLGVEQARSDLERLRLSIRAEVERAYLDLLLVRDQLGLLASLESLWLQSEALARNRYEIGEGAQSDLLRAQLERNRLRQRRWVLEAEDRRRLVVLNRLRARPSDEAVATTRSLADLPDPLRLNLVQAEAESEANSPELAKAGLEIALWEKGVLLARKDYFPDPTLTAGVMPRGKLEPMWQLGLSFNLPVFASVKQARAVAENENRKRAAAEGAQTLRRLLRQRVQERSLVLDALLQANRLYRTELLVQSEATVTSTLAQYKVGRVTFASVLEALVGYLTDRNGFLESVAAAHRIATAQREQSLDPVTGVSPSSMAATGVPGAGGMGSAPSGSSGQPSQPGEAGASSSRM